jgi:Ca-activated chloride channel homolog
MDFAHPERLWLLLALPILFAWVVHGRRCRARGWDVLGQRAQPFGDGAWTWLCAIALLIVALAQPRWGRAPAAPLPPGQDVILLVDTSRSMAAEDAIPNRLRSAVEAAETLVGALGRSPGNRAAVVAFAGRGVVRCPLTENLGAVADKLHELRPGDVQPGGSNLGAALNTALDAFDSEDRVEARTIVLLSDGEDHADTWRSLVEKLRAAGVVVHAVAIGDPEAGHPVPTGPNDEPMTYHGDLVLSRRHDEAFEALARETGGAMVRLGLKTIDLGSLYVNRIAPVARQRHNLLRAPERLEQFTAFVVAAIVVGLAGSWPSRHWARRSRRPALAALAALTLVAASGPKGVTETAADAVATGQRAYASGDIASALAAYERAIALDPQADIPRYDAAASLFQLGRYAESIARYQEARDRADAPLRIKIDYTMGNAALALGDVGDAVRHYDECLASRVSGAIYDAVRHDAAINRTFAIRLAASQQERIDDEPKAPSREAQPKKRASSSAKQNRDLPPESSPPGNPDQVSPFSPSAPSEANDSKEPPAGSPEERLASALQNVRDARRRRLSDPLPPVASSDLKEW